VLISWSHSGPSGGLGGRWLAGLYKAGSSPALRNTDTKDMAGIWVAGQGSQGPSVGCWTAKGRSKLREGLITTGPRPPAGWEVP
jgi:hypothetical protein